MLENVFLSDQPDDPIVSSVLEGLLGFNEREVGPARKTALIARLVGDDGQPLRAGLVGHTAWGWLFVEKLWVATDLRGRGRAELLLAAAECEAVGRGCKRAWLDTFNPSAKLLYERLGYEVFGELPDFVASRSRYFMKKQLVT